VRGCSSVVEHLSNMHEAPVPSPAPDMQNK
jgi:hypothetical protein